MKKINEFLNKQVNEYSFALIMVLCLFGGPMLVFGFISIIDAWY